MIPIFEFSESLGEKIPSVNKLCEKELSEDPKFPDAPKSMQQKLK
jgi:hypothetical protein